MQTAEDSISHQWRPLLCTLSAAMHNFCNRVQCHRWTWTGEEQTCTLEHLEVHWSNCCKAMEWSATARHERSIRLPGWVDCSAAAVSPDTQQQVPLASLATPPDDLGSVWTMKTDGSQAIHLFVNPSNATLEQEHSPNICFHFFTSLPHTRDATRENFYPANSR